MPNCAEVEKVTEIHTVGYEKTALADYIARLLSAGVEVLVDVRDRPVSRKKGFSKGALSKAVEDAGMRYLHVQELGDPKPGREAARAGNHELFVEIFSNHMHTFEAQAALSKLAGQVTGKSVCLTCFELDHAGCHRTIVAQHLVDLTGGVVKHIRV